MQHCSNITSHKNIQKCHKQFGQHTTWSHWDLARVVHRVHEEVRILCRDRRVSGAAVVLPHWFPVDFEKGTSHRNIFAHPHIEIRLSLSTWIRLLSSYRAPIKDIWHSANRNLRNGICLVSEPLHLQKRNLLKRLATKV